MHSKIQFALYSFHSHYSLHRFRFLLLRVLRYFNSPRMHAPLFMAQKAIPGSKPDMRLPWAYRSLPRPLSLLEPSHPLGGLKNLLSSLLPLKSIANSCNLTILRCLPSRYYFFISSKSLENISSKELRCHKKHRNICSVKVYIDCPIPCFTFTLHVLHLHLTMALLVQEVTLFYFAPKLLH